MGREHTCHALFPFSLLMIIEIKVVRDSGIEVLSFKINAKSYLNWYTLPGSELVFEDDPSLLLRGITISPILSREGQLQTPEEVKVIRAKEVKKPTKRNIELEK